MRLPTILLSAALLLPGTAAAKTCVEMTKEIKRLRVEYHDFVSEPAMDKGNTTFEQLTEKLDKIIELKNEMRKANCEIPPNPKKFKKTR